MVASKGKWLTSNTLRIARFVALAVLIIASGCLIARPALAQNDLRQNYEDVFSEWKATYVEALKVWSEFRICEESESEDLQRRYLELKQKGDALADQTILAAADCVEDAITPDPELIEFLKGIPVKYFTDSRYEDSARIGRALLKHEPNNFSLIYNTVRSAFFANDFEYAGELFDKWIALEGKLPAELQPMYDAYPQLLLDWRKEIELREQEALVNQLPRVVFETTRGSIVVELFENQAPIIVNNLMALIENQENPYFRDLSFFFALQHQFAVTGSKSDDGTQVYPLGISTEEQRRLARGHFRGSVSLDVREIDANNSAVVTGCRFLQIPIQELNRTNLVIGRVIEGMDVVDNLQPTHKLNELLEPVPMEEVIPDRLIRVVVQRKPEGKMYKPIDMQAKQNKN